MTDSIDFRHVSTSAGPIAVYEHGDPAAPDFLLLHGWPESAVIWFDLMRSAEVEGHFIAIDFPGIANSVEAWTDGSTDALARVAREIAEALGLDSPTIVGHDLGGMVAYSYARLFPDARRAVIANVAVPGVEPWSKVVANPYLWHFAFHSIPNLPETLVAGHEADYFGFFLDYGTKDPANISAETRAQLVEAYRDPRSLHAGFEEYRAFPRNVEANAGTHDIAADILYIRGETEGGDLEEYAEGLRASGVPSVTTARIPGAGHYTTMEAPAELWSVIRDWRPRPVFDR
jgi:pimeloyl-ACP methyl ester carboxylesterase